MEVKERVSKQQQVEFYQQMFLIRSFEERCGQMYMRGKIRGFLHLYIGEEAIAVGAISALQPQDYVVTHYRDHGHALARGMEPKVVMAELFGRVTGSSKGKGGSMHLFDASRNFMGGYAIVGGQLPIAVGLGLASQYLDTKAVTLCFFGDGALNQGEFHESMNLASLWRLPVVFFLENNLYGMGTHMDRTHAAGRDIFHVADHYRIPTCQIDGMNLLEVRQATLDALEHTRDGQGPFFIEARTYRFRGHSMADPVNYRDRAEEEEWKLKDPLITYRKFLLDTRASTEVNVGKLEREVEAIVDQAVEFADASPEPPPEALYEDVYA